MKKNVFTALFLATYLVWSSGLYGSSDNGIKRIHQVDLQGRVSSNQMALSNRSQVGMEALTRRIFDEMDPNIQVKAQLGSILNLLQNPIRSNEFHFEIDGFPMCQFQLKSHETLQGSTLVMGSVPDVFVSETYTVEDWPSSSLALDQAQSQRSSRGIDQPFQVLSKSRCLWVDDGQVKPVWKLNLKSAALQYSVIADSEKVHSFSNRFFHADGIAEVYSTNPVDGVLTEYPIYNLIPDSSGKVLIENDKFVTIMDASYTYFEDDAAPYELKVSDTSSDAFKEISLFTNANRALDWLESIGYKNFGTEKIRIEVHAVFGTASAQTTNNALYLPANEGSGTTYPIIAVGNGDGTILQNLALDYDVVAHELGHHVTFHTITNTSGESLVLHEGFADFFTFSKTGNACLGEGICPTNSSACAVPNQCLRTAENDYTYTSADLPTAPHLRSQFISGFLWDLYSIDGIPLETLTKILLQAIDLYLSDSGYRDFILGLLVVDEAYYEGQYCSLIYDRAVARGLEDMISEYPCSLITDKIATYGVSVSNIVNETTGTASGSRRNSFCGSIGTPFHEGHLSLLILLLSPLIISLRKRTQA